MPRFSAFVIFALGFSSLSCFAQSQPPSDPTALSLAAQAVAAMAGSNAVLDVTATGAMNTWMAGSTTDSGSVTLKVKGYGESRIDMQLIQSGSLSEVRDASTGVPEGEWISSGGGTIYTQDLCATDAAWFYPLNSAMTVAPSNGIVLSYIGLETQGGASVQHLQAYSYQVGLDSDSQAQLQQISTIDYFLDPTTLLPVSESFNMYPANGTAIPVQVYFLSYLNVAGISSPQHVQKYVNGTLQFDASITTLSFNTGIPLSIFTVPQ